MMTTGSVTKSDWSLHRKGLIDQQRHNEKIKDAIKENLADIVSREDIILSDGKTVIKVPIRSLEEYKFRYLKSTNSGSIRIKRTASGRARGARRSAM